MKSGIFRGGGTLSFNITTAVSNLWHVVIDLFSRGNSYYFEIKTAEFSYLLPIITVCLVMYLGIILWQKKIVSRSLLLAVVSIGILNLIISSVSFDPSNLPGLRRSTGVLATFYILFVLTWKYLNEHRWHEKTSQWLVISACLVLTLHHLVAYPLNLNYLKNYSKFRAGWWYILNQTPTASVNALLGKAVETDINLSCVDDKNKATECRYPEIFATLAGACLWNKLPCKQMSGYYNDTGTFVPLNVSLIHH